MPHDETDPATPYPELNRAAGAGLRLIGARNRFRLASSSALCGLAEAAERMDSSGYMPARFPVRVAFDAAHDAYARFVFSVETRWEDEDGLIESRAPGYRFRRNRLDDIRDGILPAEGPEREVAKVFQESARVEFMRDRPAAQRLLCIALLWGVDLRHEIEDPEWARRQGVFPGAEAAPTLSRLLLELAHRTEEPGSTLAFAFRDASSAVGSISVVARAFGTACCCEFEYDSVLA